MQDARVQIVAACDLRPEARAQFEKDFSAPSYSTVDGLVSDTNVECVYIASPHQMHLDHCQRAAAHGKHVLVEKPMALTVDDCATMTAACAAAGKRLIVGHSHSFDAPYQEARAILEAGALGAVQMIQALNYTDFLYRFRRPEELRTQDGGGVVYSQAAHQIDIVRLLAGAPITRVRAAMGAWDPHRPTEGAYSALLWFENSAFATITYSGYGMFDSDVWCDQVSELGLRKAQSNTGQAKQRLNQNTAGTTESQRKAEVTYGGAHYASKRERTEFSEHFGPVIVSCTHGALRIAPTGLTIYSDIGETFQPISAPQVSRSGVIDEVLTAIRNGAPTLHDGKWGQDTLAACLALLQSHRVQSDVVLAPRA